MLNAKTARFLGTPALIYRQIAFSAFRKSAIFINPMEDLSKPQSVECSLSFDSCFSRMWAFGDLEAG